MHSGSLVYQAVFFSNTPPPLQKKKKKKEEEVIKIYYCLLPFGMAYVRLSKNLVNKCTELEMEFQNL